MTVYHQEPGAKHRYGWDFADVVTPGADLNGAVFSSVPDGLVFEDTIVEGTLVTSMVSSNGSRGLFEAICSITLPDGRRRAPAIAIRFA
ncbi:MAG: hypothetical protein AAF607_06140 [Pseudomonadota bacterium]